MCAMECKQWQSTIPFIVDIKMHKIYTCITTITTTTTTATSASTKTDFRAVMSLSLLWGPNSREQSKLGLFYTFSVLFLHRCDILCLLVKCTSQSMAMASQGSLPCHPLWGIPTFVRVICFFHFNYQSQASFSKRLQISIILAFLLNFIDGGLLIFMNTNISFIHTLRCTICTPPLPTDREVFGP